MKLTKRNIITLLERCSNFADDNLKEIEKLGINLNNEHDSFFVGLIIRQFAICNDLASLFRNKTSKFISSEFILFRALIDDYLHVTYLMNQEDYVSEVTKFNADAVSKNFRKLMDLAELNETKLGGNYPHYPTYAQMETVKEQMKNSPRRQNHFLDKENFKFKTFKATGNIIRDLGDVEYSHQMIRAYFIWRKFSDYVHYSNLTYEEESMIKPGEDSTYEEFSEIIFYSYSNVKNSLIHFDKKFNLKVIDSANLAEFYKDAEHK